MFPSDEEDNQFIFIPKPKTIDISHCFMECEHHDNSPEMDCYYIEVRWTQTYDFAECQDARLVMCRECLTKFQDQINQALKGELK